MPESEGHHDACPRNPIHPKALRDIDIVPEQRVLSFIPTLGFVEDLTVVGKPYAKTWQPDTKHESTDLMVRLRYTGEDFTRECLARELGLVQHDGRWSRFQFLLDYEDGLELLATGRWSFGNETGCTACLPPPHPCTS